MKHEFEVVSAGDPTRIFVDLGEVVAIREVPAEQRETMGGGAEIFLEGGFSFVVRSEYEQVKALLSEG